MATDVTKPSLPSPLAGEGSEALRAGEGAAPSTGQTPSPLTRPRSAAALSRKGRGQEATLILFALEREAAPLRRLARDLPHVRVHVTGVGRVNARRAAEHLLANQPAPELVIAAGFCGALVPALRVGDVVTSPRIFTADHIVGTPAEKRLLAEQHDADAVDMESDAIADVCAARGVPFRAVRAVSDAADTALSPELERLLSGGNVSPWKAIRALVRRPALLREFLRLARDTKLASRNLANELLKIVTPVA